MSFMSRFTEANTAHIEVSHVSSFTSTLETSTYYLALELWWTLCAYDY